MTDDQTLRELRWMPKTRKNLGGHGVTFTGARSPAPLCCPARAEIVTGQLGQNNGVRFNRGRYGGFSSLRGKANTIGTWLQRAGYETAMVGKYLNGYPLHERRQRGRTRWNPTVRGIYSYFGTTFYGDGVEQKFAGNVTPVIAAYTAGYVREFAADEKPFFIWASHVAPHHARSRKPFYRGPPRPSARHRHPLEKRTRTVSGQADLQRGKQRPTALPPADGAS
jgi:N-acetylglucosamine-6-sulfatase